MKKEIYLGKEKLPTEDCVLMSVTNVPEDNVVEVSRSIVTQLPLDTIEFLIPIGTTNKELKETLNLFLSALQNGDDDEEV